MSTDVKTVHPRDAELRRRAERVIPAGMNGHHSTVNMHLPPNFPQFLAEGEGPYIRDVDGNQYIDLLCSYGPIILGHRHPAVEEAARRQAELGDCLDAPSPRIVELAELFTSTVEHADWVVFAKNGTDATTSSLTVARAATGRSIILAVRGSYHGAAPWCTPWPAGVLPQDRANMRYFDYNDAESFNAAVSDAGDQFAGVIITPFKHIEGFDQELVEPEFARLLRRTCDEHGALLILDDVRCGFRMHLGGSWEPIGVRPDLSAWSKGIANGYALAAITGSEKYREIASKIYMTGSFWFAAVSMAAAIATINTLRTEDAVARMARAGGLLKAGVDAQARAHDLVIHYTGHPTMPYITFEADTDYQRMTTFAAAALDAGTYLAPRHNWFLNAAHSEEIIKRVLESTDRAFDAVRQVYGAD